MELIYKKTADGVTTEGFLRNYEADFDITTEAESPTNDFEIIMPLPSSASDMLYLENQISTIVYADGSEFGGIISGYSINVAESTITYTGRTWRGLLSQYIIEPPSGQDYRIVAAGTNLATALRALPMHPLISIQNTSYTSGNAQFKYNRYIPVHEGVTSLLRASNESLRLKFAYDETTGKVLLSIEPTADRTDLIDISQDYNERVKLSIARDGNTPKHVICLGAGELAQREVIHLYADDDWNISTTPIAGAYPVEIYEYSGSGALQTDGIKHYKELIGNHEQLDVKIDGLDINLSDIIAARDTVTGESVTAEVTNIIWKCTDMGTYQTESFEYQTKVRSIL